MTVADKVERTDGKLRDAWKEVAAWAGLNAIVTADMVATAERLAQ
jgi:hypothetical protein